LLIDDKTDSLGSKFIILYYTYIVMVKLIVKTYTALLERLEDKIKNPNNLKNFESKISNFNNKLKYLRIANAELLLNSKLITNFDVNTYEMKEKQIEKSKWEEIMTSVYNAYKDKYALGGKPYKYLGPGTDIGKNIADNIKPYNEIDRLAREHDLEYTLIGTLDNPKQKKALMKLSDNRFLERLKNFGQRSDEYDEYEMWYDIAKDKFELNYKDDLYQASTEKIDSDEIISIINNVGRFIDELTSKKLIGSASETKTIKSNKEYNRKTANRLAKHPSLLAEVQINGNPLIFHSNDFKLDKIKQNTGQVVSYLTTDLETKNIEGANPQSLTELEQIENAINLKLRLYKPDDKSLEKENEKMENDILNLLKNNKIDHQNFSSMELKNKFKKLLINKFDRIYDYAKKANDNSELQKFVDEYGFDVLTPEQKILYHTIFDDSKGEVIFKGENPFTNKKSNYGELIRNRFSELLNNLHTKGGDKFKNILELNKNIQKKLLIEIEKLVKPADYKYLNADQKNYIEKLEENSGYKLYYGEDIIEEEKKEEKKSEMKEENKLNPVIENILKLKITARSKLNRLIITLRNINFDDLDHISKERSALIYHQAGEPTHHPTHNIKYDEIDEALIKKLHDAYEKYKLDHYGKEGEIKPLPSAEGEFKTVPIDEQTELKKKLDELLKPPHAEPTIEGVREQKGIPSDANSLLTQRGLYFPNKPYTGERNYNLFTIKGGVDDVIKTPAEKKVSEEFYRDFTLVMPGYGNGNQPDYKGKLQKPNNSLLNAIDDNETIKYHGRMYQPAEINPFRFPLSANTRRKYAASMFPDAGQKQKMYPQLDHELYTGPIRMANEPESVYYNMTEDRYSKNTRLYYPDIILAENERIMRV
jgi:hypothetical protein